MSHDEGKERKKEGKSFEKKSIYSFLQFSEGKSQGWKLKSEQNFSGTISQKRVFLRGGVARAIASSAGEKGQEKK